jgi:DNA-binding transcriptional ArsR family regulator
MSIDVDGSVEELSADVVEACKALADPVRWRIVQLLAAEELCGCHLVDELGIGQSLVSHHLKALREAGLVSSHRYRYWSYYRLQPAALTAVGYALGELAETATFAGQARRPCQ